MTEPTIPDELDKILNEAVKPKLKRDLAKYIQTLEKKARKETLLEIREEFIKIYGEPISSIDKVYAQLENGTGVYTDV